MRAVIQRCRRAEVAVGGSAVAAIDRGLLTLVGVAPEDHDAAAAWLARKIATLRVFDGPGGRFDLPVGAVGGAVLVVPNFTLYGDATRGRRTDWTGAAAAGSARRLFRQLVVDLADSGVPVAAGVFGADMTVTLEADGPVTLVVDTPPGSGGACP